MKLVYHASHLKNLKIIQPKKTLSRDIYIGDYVFATADMRLAAMYLAPRENATLMSVDADNPTMVICNNPEGYNANDEGGAIYTIPATTFKRTPQAGLEASELVSDVPVKPTSLKIYKRSIDAMQEMGVTIYFVDQETFDSLVRAKDESKIIKTLQPYVE